MTKAAARKRVQEAIGKLAAARDSGHMSRAHMEKLWKMQGQLQNIGTSLK